MSNGGSPQAYTLRSTPPPVLFCTFQSNLNEIISEHGLYNHVFNMTLLSTESYAYTGTYSPGIRPVNKIHFKVASLLLPPPEFTIISGICSNYHQGMILHSLQLETSVHNPTLPE